VSARKRFGQHFLEAAWVDKLIQTIQPKTDQVLLEIGPGHGALTRPLAARAKHVIAFEIDRDLAAELTAAPLSNVTVVVGDFLGVEPDDLRTTLAGAGGADTCRAVGNLPYNVASPILFRLIGLRDSGIPIVDATVMLQREVANRLTAAPGTHEYGVVTVLVGHVATAERLLTLPPGAFRPAPRVQSAVVRLVFHPPTPMPVDRRVFEVVVRGAFTRRRKTLVNALEAVPLRANIVPAEALKEAGLDGRRRPETLAIPEWVALADIYARRSGDHLLPKAGAVL
jgi:16S rRNA (adenine1518-N6/adenine1519-N6)-dimethyltransferase